jgi:sugar phosphate isomerase/epimerase
MSQNRRAFLQKAGILSAGALLAKNSLFAASREEKIKHLGIELWSVKDEMANDAKATLQQLATFGYKQVESFQHAKLGMFWGMAPKDFKSYLDSIGLKTFGSHCGEWDKPEFEKLAADAADAGMKYLLCPSLNDAMKLKQKSIDEFKVIADRFNTCGDICKKNGMRFGYHTHGYSYFMLDGQRPIEYLIANTNPDTVDFEMDIYWVVTAGADPIELLKKYGSRVRLCHIKDRMKTAAPNEEFASCIVGEGSIDFAKILPVAKSTGVKYFTIEQEKFDGTTPMLAAQADAKYVLNLSI